MNKLTTSLALISTMFMAGIAYAADGGLPTSGKIEFEGKVIGGTCAIKQGEVDKTVKLPNVELSKLQSDGAVAEPTSFYINLTGCYAGDTVQVKFTPNTTKIDLTTGNLENNVGTNFAKNVQVQLLDAENKVIKLNDAPTIDAVVTGGDYSIPFKAQYYAAGKNNVTVGLVQANVGFTLNYK